MKTTPEHPQALVGSMVLVLTYWLNYEFVRRPRRASEGTEVDGIFRAGSFQALSLLSAYLDDPQRQQLTLLGKSPPSSGS